MIKLVMVLILCLAAYQVSWYDENKTRKELEAKGVEY